MFVYLGNTRVRFVDKNGDGLIQVDTTDEKINELTASYHYYPFGMMWEGGHYRKDPNNPPPTQGNFFAPQDVKNKYRYNGKEFIEDFVIGLYDYGARWYDPRIGRFLSVDPLADKYPGWNPYHYVYNNPVRLVDPDGMEAEWIDNGDGTWTAEKGDHAGTLAIDAGITYDQANAIIQAQYGENRKENGVEYSNVNPGDVVDVEGQFDIWHADFVANHTITILDQPNSNEAEAMMAIFDPEIVGTILMIGEYGVGRNLPKTRGYTLKELPVKPSVKFPGYDPTKAPDGYEWRGKPDSTPGSKNGNYYNPRTKETLRPDLNHPDPIGPHWDYRNSSGKWFRIFPDDKILPK